MSNIDESEEQQQLQSEIDKNEPDKLFPNAGQPTVFGNDFGWKSAKHALYGAICGLGIGFTQDLLKNKGRVINHYKPRLKIGVEGMDDQIDLCQRFVFLRQFETYHPRAYDKALLRCEDLCVLGERLATPKIFQELSESVRLGKVKDVYKEFDFDVKSEKYWFKLCKQLKRLLIKVRKSEKQLFLDREYHEKDYAEKEKIYKKTLQHWEFMEAAAKKKDREEIAGKQFDLDDLFAEETKTDMQKLHIDSIPPKPVKPIRHEILDLTLKSDDCKKAIDHIIHQTLVIQHRISLRTRLLREIKVETSNK